MRDFLKTGVRVAAGLFVLALLYVAWLWLQPDEKRNPELQAALEKRARAANDANSGAIALLGMEAPLGVDFLDYGRKLLAVELAGGDTFAFAKELNGNAAPLALRMNERIHCWEFRANEIPDSLRANCASAEEARAYLQANAELLRRYRVALNMPTPSASLNFRGQFTINASKLNMLEVTLDAREGKVDEAYRKWREHYVYQRAMLGKGSNWILTAINLVNEGLSLATLENLAEAAPSVLMKYRADLKRLLKPEGLASYNLGEIPLGEIESMHRYIGTDGWARWVRKERLGNRMYEERDAFRRVSQSSAPALEIARLVPLNKKIEVEARDLVDPTTALYWHQTVRWNKSAELLHSMLAKDAQRRLWTLRLDMLDRQIADPDIATFVAQTPEALRSPWDQSAPQWDARKRLLSMTRPGTSSRVELQF